MCMSTLYSIVVCYRYRVAVALFGGDTLCRLRSVNIKARRHQLRIFQRLKDRTVRYYADVVQLVLTAF